MREKGFAQILIIILALIAIGGAYYFGTQKNNVLTTPVQSSVPAVTEATTQASPTTDPTANWKTYTNTQYGFTFKYPPGLETLLQSEGGVSGPITGNPIFVYALADKLTIAQGTDKPFDGLSIDIVDTNGSLDTYVSNERDAEKNSYRGIFDPTIKQLNIPVQNRYLDSESSISRYFLKSNNTVVAISVIRFSPDFMRTASQILSTFKFTQ